MDYDRIADPTECRMIVARADVAGFSKACQNKSNLDTFRMLDTFYHLVHRLTTDAGGKVVKFLGDAALMIYPVQNAAEAIAGLESLKSEAQDLWFEFDETCVVRTKAHIGPVVCGAMGPEKRFDAIGNTINELYRMPADGPDISDGLQRILRT